MLSKNEVRKLAKLSNLSLSDQEIELFTPQLAEIIDYFNKLKNLNIPEDKKGESEKEKLRNRFQENPISHNTLSREDALRNASKPKSNYFSTNAVIKYD